VSFLYLRVPLKLFLLSRTVGVLNDLLKSIITIFCLVTHNQLEVSFTYTVSEDVCDFTIVVQKSRNLEGLIETRVRQLKNLHRVLRLGYLYACYCRGRQIFHGRSSDCKLCISVSIVAS